MENKKTVLNTIEYIEKNLYENLSLDHISKKMNYSKFYLERLFFKAMGCTIYKYIKTRRLEKAAKELIDTDKPISEIALEANYNSQQAFTLAFRKVYNYTPKAFRNIYVINNMKGVMAA